ncbi:MAG TPA: AraC family transcriptional regulator [Candidatus Mediterraneibacter intestinigallinarum]|nr:AraC family transcriptional regulator [Candidatus Mediterraneibacter intestinigallinarum]
MSIVFIIILLTSYTLKQISSYVGIKDEYYFSRVFKSKTGMSPRQYRATIHE